jgi:hypothetical protein
MQSSDWRQRAAMCYAMAGEAEDPRLKTLLQSLGDEMLGAAEDQELLPRSTTELHPQQRHRTGRR